MTFIALALQMGHELKDTLHDYWSRFRQLHTLFYDETLTWDRLLHTLHFLHFAENSQRPDNGKEYDWLWNVRTVFDTLNKAYAKFYNPSKHLAVDEVIVKFKGRVIFRKYCPKKKEQFWQQNLQTLWRISIHMTWKCTWVKTHIPPLTKWLQSTQMLDIWLAEVKAEDTKYLWTISFHPWDFLMTWTDVK